MLILKASQHIVTTEKAIVNVTCIIKGENFICCCTVHHSCRLLCYIIIQLNPLDKLTFIIFNNTAKTTFIFIIIIIVAHNSKYVLVTPGYGEKETINE